jgi:hypothetical protein
LGGSSCGVRTFLLRLINIHASGCIARRAGRVRRRRCAFLSDKPIQNLLLEDPQAKSVVETMDLLHEERRPLMINAHAKANPRSVFYQRWIEWFYSNKDYLDVELNEKLDDLLRDNLCVRKIVNMAT